MDTTTVDATLRVVGIDLDSPGTGEVLATQFPTLIWEEQGNLVTFTVSASRDDIMTQVLGVCRRMESAIPGLKVEGVVRDFVNATDIANRVDLSREAVRKWTSRTDFPKPEGVVGGDSMKIWAWTQVVQWLQDVRGIDMEDNLLTMKQMTQLENCLMRNPDHTTVQWHKAAQAAPVFQPTQRGTGRRVIIDATSGRGQSSAESRRPALVAASGVRN